MGARDSGGCRAGALLLGFCLASCSVDLNDLANGGRDAAGNDSAGQAGSATGDGGAGGSTTAGGGGVGGAAGSTEADANRDGPAGTGATAGAGGIAGDGGVGGATREGGIDASGGAAGVDGGGGLDGSSGSAGQSGGAGTSGADAGVDLGVVDMVLVDVPRDGPDSHDASGPCQAGTCKRVFVSLDPVSADLGGLAGGDAFCQSAANAVELGGTWKAWLSDGTTSVSARLIHATVPYVLLDGTTVASNWSSLTSGALAHAIDVSEDGTAHASEMLEVWTATTSAGAFSGRSCSGWTNNTSGSSTADVGLSSEVTSDWTDRYQQYCDRMNVHLYCFEQ